MSKLIYDVDIDRTALDGQRVAVIGYGSQGEAHSRNLSESGADVVVGLRPDSASAERARAAGLRVTDAASAAAEANVVMMLVPDTAAPAVYRSEVEPGPARRQAADVRSRLQHPFRADRPARRRRCRDGGAEGSRPPRAPAVRGGRRRAGPLRRASRRDGHGSAADARLRAGHRRGPCRRPRDLVRRGDRDGPLRRAGGAVRRRDRIGPGGLRDARRRRLPARARVLRDDARAQAHR